MYGEAALRIRRAKHFVAFTGAGISVESGVPPFRGPGGVYESVNPKYLELEYFRLFPADAWRWLKSAFFDVFLKVRPNPAHYALARLEAEGLLHAVITQNIDGLHRAAGSALVHEYHGTWQSTTCLECGLKVPTGELDLERLPPLCSCGGLLKPDVIFFGEPIPEETQAASFETAMKADLLLIIGTTGEVMPASLIPELAYRNSATIIEINPRPSSFTGRLTELFIKAPAAEAMIELLNSLNLDLPEYV